MLNKRRRADHSYHVESLVRKVLCLAAGGCIDPASFSICLCDISNRAYRINQCWLDSPVCYWVTYVIAEIKGTNKQTIYPRYFSYGVNLGYELTA